MLSFERKRGILTKLAQRTSAAPSLGIKVPPPTTAPGVTPPAQGAGKSFPGNPISTRGGGFYPKPQLSQKVTSLKPLRRKFLSRRPVVDTASSQLRIGKANPDLNYDEKEGYMRNPSLPATRSFRRGNKAGQLPFAAPPSIKALKKKLFQKSTTKAMGGEIT